MEVITRILFKTL